MEEENEEKKGKKQKRRKSTTLMTVKTTKWRSKGKEDEESYCTGVHHGRCHNALKTI